MTDTIRELIIQEFISRAAVIRTTGTPQIYATDIGETVLRARGKVDPDDLPCVVVWPGSEEAEAKYGRIWNKMTLRIDGLMLFGAADPSVISERILGDLIACFTSPTWDRRIVVSATPGSFLPPLAESIAYQGGGTDEAVEDGAVSAGASIRLLVSYFTAVGDPYTQ